MRKKVEEGGKRKTYLKIDTPENINKTLSKPANIAMNTDDKFVLDKIRLVNEIIKTKISVVRQQELEARIREIEQILDEESDLVG